MAHLHWSALASMKPDYDKPSTELRPQLPPPWETVDRHPLERDQPGDAGVDFEHQWTLGSVEDPEYVTLDNELGQPVQRSLQTLSRGVIELIIKALKVDLEDDSKRQSRPPRSALDEGMFRVLYLTKDHSRPDIPLGNLRQQSEHSSQGYTAISYTWLKDEYTWYKERLPETSQLRIDGVAVNLPFHVVFILSVLFNMGIHCVWLDYVCINQEDGLERGHQVGRMNQIFQNAEEVVIFLGKPSDRTHDTLRELCAGLNDHGDYVFGAAKNVIHTAGLHDIAQHKYWSRAWVLQEIGLAKRLKIVCGRFILDNHKANDLIRRLIGFLTADAAKALLTLINKVAMGVRPPLLDIVIASRYAQCSEPRDALYAKMHLAKDGDILGQPDYSKSIGMVFHLFAVACIAKSGDLRILSFASGHNNDLGVPSWVPDWTPRQDMSEMRLRSGYGSTLKESVRRCEPFFLEDDRILVARGWILRKMQPFQNSQYMAVYTQEIIHRPAEGHWLDTIGVDDETFLCLLFGCPTILVLAEKEHHYVVVNVSGADAVRQWAQNELNGLTKDRRILEFPITEFKVA